MKVVTTFTLPYSHTPETPVFATVVVDIERPDAPGPLTYQVPDALQESIRVGSYVRVPLGTREALGYVVGIGAPAPAGAARPILSLLHPDPLFDAPLLHLAVWIAGRYHASLAETLRCLVPDGLTTRLRRLISLQGVPEPEAAAAALERRSPVLAALVRLLADPGSADAGALRARWEGSDLSSALARLRARGWIREELVLDSPPIRARRVAAYAAAAPAAVLRAEAAARRARAPAQARALDLFSAQLAPLTLSEAGALGAPASALRVLTRDGLLRKDAVVVRRNPWHQDGSRTTPPALTPAQQRAAAAILEALTSGQHDTILVHGVTASGKTEVYLHAIEAALGAGRDAIMLLPEISLTAQVVEVFKGRLGDRVALLHSRLSAGERYDEWRRLRAGEARVAVGARSALFAPCPRPGLIVVDEEHEPSYKQENSPRYHARRTALERARAADAVLVLGSATPAVESYFAAAGGEYRLVEMPERVPGRVQPAIHVVDLRAAGRQAAPGVFSDPLLAALADRLARGEQAILFLNRRGFASFILCRDCGFSARCPHCSVSLTLHASDHTLRCHHCNHQRAAPTLCPRCRSERIRPFGLGTERVEAEARARFPEARVLRMDRDTTTAKDAHGRLYRAFRAGEADILVGTQMVAKGLDFPNVTLVGILAADTGLNMPDYRAAERTFQLLTQASGRAGRGPRPGEVIIQTFDPDNYAIRAARDLDYASFYRQEVDFRRELGYPPFGALVNVLAADPESAAAQARASRAAMAIAREAKREESDVEVLGPAPAPLARIKRRYRWHAIVRGPRDEEVQAVVRRGLDALPAADRAALSVDVDPASTM
ncbi:MAG: primosomal protein N' [Armatimonadetes bacterium]|nr:primosomal protein N' [Armatimonadota bacterium]